MSTPSLFGTNITDDLVSGPFGGSYLPLELKGGSGRHPKPRNTRRQVKRNNKNKTKRNKSRTRKRRTKGRRTKGRRTKGRRTKGRRTRHCKCKICRCKSCKCNECSPIQREKNIRVRTFKKNLRLQRRQRGGGDDPEDLRRHEE